MARTGVTYEDVVEAIDSLIVSGNSITIKSIREFLGTGSPNTILRHLTVWRESAPTMERKAVSLPDALQSVIVAEIEKREAAARVEIEGKLQVAREDSSVLSETGEKLEAENSELIASNQTLTDEKNRFEALAEERHTEIEELKKELNESRNGKEKLTLDLAQSLNKLETLEDQATEKDKQISLAGEEKHLLEQELISAKTDLAVLRSEKSGLEKSQAELKETNVSLNNSNKEVNLLLNDSVKNLNNNLQKLAVSESKLESTSIQIEQSKEQFSDMQTELRELRAESLKLAAATAQLEEIRREKGKNIAESQST